MEASPSCHQRPQGIGVEGTKQCRLENRERRLPSDEVVLTLAQLPTPERTHVKP